MTFEPGGKHVIMEAAGIDAQLLDNTQTVSDILVTAAEKARCHVLSKSFHKFSPQGVSGVVVISESHISIHTWPESEYAAIDIFTCGEEADPRVALDHMISEFKPESIKERWIARGLPE